MIPRKRKSYSDISLKNVIESPIKDIEADEVSTGNSQEISAILPSDIVRMAAEVAFVAEFAEKDQTLTWDTEGYGRYGSLSEAAGTITKVLVSSLPRTNRERISRAYYHVERDDLLSCLIQALVDFSSVGFSLQAKPPVSTGNKKEDQDSSDSSVPSQGDDSQGFQQTLNDLSLKIDIGKLADTLLYDWFVSDSMILYWRVPPHMPPGSYENGEYVVDELAPDTVTENKYGVEGISDITALCPADVDWDNTIGRDIMRVKIPNSVKDTVNEAFIAGATHQMNREEVYEALNAQGIPKKWVDAVRNGRDYVQLLKEDGDRWLVRTKARKSHGLACPTMFTIFLDLEIRRILKEGDASAALMMKHFIMLIKQGESIESGPLAGHTKNWLQPKDAKALLRRFSVVNKAIRAAVNHTTKIEFVFPPKEMFDGQKYIEPNSRIFSWSGVTPILISGDGGKYASGFLSIKRLIGKIKKAREELNTLYTLFFMDESIQSKIGTPKGYLVSSVFDSNVLKEPKQLLDEIKFMFETGISDPRTAARELERDPDTLKSSSLQSKKENEQLQVWEKMISQHQLEQEKIAEQERSRQGIGVGSGNGKKSPTSDKGGRPANPGTQTGAATSNQSPRAQQ